MLAHPRRVWAVAAVHGAAARLRALHDSLERRFVAGDRLVYTGNLLGRGDAVRETADEVLLFRRALLARFLLQNEDIVILRGGQEEMWHKLLQLHLAHAPAQVAEWMFANGAAATLASYGGDADEARMRCREGALALARWTGQLREAVRRHSGHEELLFSLRRAAVSDNGRLLFVHCGLDITRPLADQADSFWWGASDFQAINEPYEGFARIVRGYDPNHAGADNGAVAITIDGNCGFGGELVAVCFDSDGAMVDQITV